MQSFWWAATQSWTVYDTQRVVDTVWSYWIMGLPYEGKVASVIKLYFPWRSGRGTHASHDRIFKETVRTNENMTDWLAGV